MRACLTSRILVAIVIATTLAALAVGSVSAYFDGGWPETCVEMNDMVETHLGNSGNVGIYQKVFGDQAEKACQNDHRSDVQGAFGWAFGIVSQPSDWLLKQGQDPLTGIPWIQAQLNRVLEVRIDGEVVRRGPVMVVYYDESLGFGVIITSETTIFGGADYRIKVEYRFDSNEVVTEDWLEYTIDNKAVWTRDQKAVKFAQSVVTSKNLLFRATPDGRRGFTYSFELPDSADEDHPVRIVLARAGYGVPAVREWPVSCVALNDIVEASSQGSGAVGIYQRAFGSDAEIACQGDHRGDVRATFAWAFP